MNNHSAVIQQMRQSVELKARMKMSHAFELYEKAEKNPRSWDAGAWLRYADELAKSAERMFHTARSKRI